MFSPKDLPKQRGSEFLYIYNENILITNSLFCYHQQIDKAPSEATFRGTEFLSYDLGQTGGEPIVSAQDAISLYFRTRQPNGLLFFTGERDTTI